MSFIFLAVVAVLCAISSALLTWGARGVARRRRWFDQPNARSAHARPTARVGGIGIVLGFLWATALSLSRSHALGLAAVAILGGMFSISALGLADDFMQLRARSKLLMQLLLGIAVIAVLHAERAAPLISGGGVLAEVVTGVTVLWIVWVTNLYNFMDGIDGLAGGQAVIAGICIGIAAYRTGDSVVAVLSFLLAAASSGFLIFNFPPASVFMGDVGSTAIGFTFGALPLLSSRPTTTLPVTAIALSMFILDASVTLLRRLARREDVFAAHRSHYYQRLLAHGLSHRPITLTAYAAMSAVGVAAIFYPAVGASGRAGLAAFPVLLFAALVHRVATIERACWPRRPKNIATDPRTQATAER